MIPYLLFFYLYLATHTDVPPYESPAKVFVQVEKAGYVPPWSEPPILKGNSIADRIKESR